MKSVKKFSVLLLSAALLFAQVTPAWGATVKDTGAKAENADSVQIIGLGGIYNVGVNTTAFNAVIPDGFTAARLYVNGTQLTNFSCTPSETTNNYRVTFERLSSGSDIKVVGESLIRLEADYATEGDAVITKSAEKMMHTYAFTNTGLTEVLNQNFNSLAADFDSMTNANKATAIKGSGTAAISLDPKDYTVTNAAFDGDLHGVAGNKALLFSGGTGKNMATLQITPTNKTQTQILNFSFYASGEYSLDVIVDANEKNKTNDERLILHNMQPGTWHDVGIVYDPATLKATAYVDGVESTFALENKTINNIRLRPTPGEGTFVAIDDLSLKWNNGRLPDVDSLEYYASDLANRVTTANGAVPTDQAKAFVLTLSRGSVVWDGVKPKQYSGSLYDAQGNVVDDVSLTYVKREKATTGEASDTYHFIFEKASGTFAPGKYTAVMNGSTVMGGVAIRGQLRRDFYVTEENGISVTPGDCSYDGTTFTYNLSYSRLADKDMTVLAAIYSGDALKTVKIINTKADAHEISGSLSAEGNRAALMIWDSAEGLHPYIGITNYYPSAE